MQRPSINFFIAMSDTDSNNMNTPALDDLLAEARAEAATDEVIAQGGEAVEQLEAENAAIQNQLDEEIMSEVNAVEHNGLVLADDLLSEGTGEDEADVTEE